MKQSRSLATLFALPLLAFPCFSATVDPKFDSQIAPILKERCASCHNPQTRTSGFSIATPGDLLKGGALRGPAVIPGKAADSPLIKLVRGEISPRMPIGMAALSGSEVKVLEDWINGLAASKVEASAAPRWWSLEPPKRAVPPAVHSQAWVRNPIDQFVLAKLDAHSLHPSPEASKATLIRRAYFDLIGLPPQPEEVKAFVNDPSPDAYEKLVDRLLADTRFGERWGRHWLDLARYADTDGLEGDMERPHMWRYRDYVIRSFNEDRPYDKFVREQIAGDEMAATDPEGPVAVGFLRLAAWHPLGVTEEARQALLSEMTGAVGAVYLGLTVKCAQCHDHKYDPISQKDFYRLQSFFVPIELVDAKVDFTDPAVARRMEQGHAEYTSRLKQAEDNFHAYEAELLPKLDRILKHEKGPEAKATPALLFDRLTRNDAGTISVSADPQFTSAEKQKFLELYFPIDDGSIRTLRDTGDVRRQLARYDPAVHTIRSAVVTSRGPGLPHNYIRLGGDYSQLGEMVTPGFLSAVKTGHDAVDPDEEVPRRSHLADWIADPNNPLTARVMVNRIWQHVYGVPIVGTPSDFGRNGSAPTNQELLDWMATEFVQRKWSMKSMIRLMMTSATYRQSSMESTPEAEKLDPANQMMWRMNRKRLEGELIRDSYLSVSAELNPEHFGPGVFPVLPGNLSEITIKNKRIWESSTPSQADKRSIYVFQRRQLEVPFLNVMDAPVLNLSCERRTNSTTAVQALTMLNDEFAFRAASDMAARIVHETGPDPREQVERAFEIAFARKPDKDDLEKSTDFIRRSKSDGLKAFCMVLLNSNEFIYVN